MCLSVSPSDLSRPCWRFFTIGSHHVTAKSAHFVRAPARAFRVTVQIAPYPQHATTVGLPTGRLQPARCGSRRRQRAGLTSPVVFLGPVRVSRAQLYRSCHIQVFNVERASCPVTLLEGSSSGLKRTRPFRRACEQRAGHHRWELA